MPATVQVKVIAARNLPIMDRSSELTDAFVGGKVTKETQYVQCVLKVCCMLQQLLVFCLLMYECECKLYVVLHCA